VNLCKPCVQVIIFTYASLLIAFSLSISLTSLVITVKKEQQQKLYFSFLSTFHFPLFVEAASEQKIVVVAAFKLFHFLNIIIYMLWSSNYDGLKLIAKPTFAVHYSRPIMAIMFVFCHKMTGKKRRDKWVEVENI
jgi:hypothetical protein